MTESGEIPPHVKPVDIPDSLKTEVSAFSPHEQQRFQSVARGMSDFLVRNFQAFIPSDSLSKRDILEKNIIVVDKVALQSIPFEWQGKVPPCTINGFTSRRGNLIFLQTPEDFWEQLSTKTKASEIRRAGSEEKAREDYGWTEFKTTLAHEIVHLYGNRFGSSPRLPLWFDEAGAYYYSRIIDKEMNPDYLIGGRSERMIELYEKLISLFNANYEIHK